MFAINKTGKNKMEQSQVEFMIGKEVLITTDSWFIAPDGESYKSVYGKLQGIFLDRDILGVKTNAKSTNWYAQVGGMIIAGCQIHYVINCENETVNTDNTNGWQHHEGKVVISNTPSKIYHSKI